MITAWAIGTILTAAFLVWIMRKDWKWVFDEVGWFALALLVACSVGWPVFWAVMLFMNWMERDE